MPTVNPDDLGPALDLRVITPSLAALDPLPRAILITVSGVLDIEAPEALPTLSVIGGQILWIRPVRVLPTTTATVVALY